MIKQLYKKLMKVRIINFMLVGSLGFIVSAIVYYPLSFYFKDNVEFLGQVFYLPACIPSTIASLSFNYFMNKRITFRDCRSNSLGYWRYMSTGMITAIADIFLIFLLVTFVLSIDYWWMAFYYCCIINVLS